MFAKLTLISAAVTAAILLTSAAAVPAHAQYGGYGYGGYGPYRYSPRTFDDYVDSRVRQLQIQRQFGAPYYPYLDRQGYYDRQRYRADIYRPYYEGRRFRYNRPYYDYDYDYRYDSGRRYRYYVR